MWSLDGYKQLHYNAVKTTQDIKVCKVKNLPSKKPKLKLQKHIETGICLMLHTIEDRKVLEIRGYDEDCKEFSYKFHFENSQEQTLNMKALGILGDVHKLKVSLDDKEQHNRKEVDYVCSILG